MTAATWTGRKGPFGRNVAWSRTDLPGVQVRHCGHPTALRPYYVTGLGEDSSVFGRTFRLLSDAQAAAVAAFNEARTAC